MLGVGHRKVPEASREGITEEVVFGSNLERGEIHRSEESQAGPGGRGSVCGVEGGHPGPVGRVSGLLSAAKQQGDEAGGPDSSLCQQPHKGRVAVPVREGSGGREM